jgi:hypothetical protein
MSVERIDVADGKYTVVINGGGLHALRYGEPWQDLIGNKFVYCLATELQGARDEIKRLRAELERKQNHAKP